MNTVAISSVKLTYAFRSSNLLCSYVSRQFAPAEHSSTVFFSLNGTQASTKVLTNVGVTLTSSDVTLCVLQHVKC
jgi:hypothetical protein